MKPKNIVSVILLVVLLGSATLTTTQAKPENQAVQPPQQLTYQGHLLDAAGQPVLDGTYRLTFSLWDAPAAGNLLWGPEDHDVETGDGFFSVLLGTTCPIDAFDLAANTYVEIEVEGETLSPRQLLAPVAFALSASRAGHADAATDADLLDGQDGAYYLDWTHLTDIPAGFADGVDDDTVYSDADALGAVEAAGYLTGTGVMQVISNTRAITLSVTYAAEAGDADILGGREGTYYLDWSNFSHVPAGFADGVDDDTTYSAGTGLTLVGTQFSVDGAAVQQRVSGACAVGSTVRSINADGTVACESHDTRPVHSSVVLDGNAGHPYLEIGADGLPLIAYYDSANGDLKAAHCDDLSCSSATISTLDSTGDVGLYTSVAIGADGLPLISYEDFTNRDLKVAHCDDAACSSATITTLDAPGLAGSNSKVTIGADGLGLIAYAYGGGADLKVAHCENVACTSATITNLNGGANIYEMSIAVGVDGLGIISFYEGFSQVGLRVAHCENPACTSATFRTVDSTGASNLGRENSITIGTDGLPIISYYDGTGDDLRVAHCDDLLCSSATITTLDSAGDVGAETSIAIGADGLPLISYEDATNADLKVAHCSDVACTSAVLTTLDASFSSSYATSTVVGVDGMPVAAYIDGDLRVAHCSNAFCTPYVRRR